MLLRNNDISSGLHNDADPSGRVTGVVNGLLLELFWY